MPVYDAMIKRPDDGEPDPLVPEPSGAPATKRPLGIPKAKKAGKSAKSAKKGK